MEGLRAAGVETVLVGHPAAPLFLKATERGLAAAPLAISSLRAPADLVHAHDARSHALAVALARAPAVVARRVAFPVGKGLVSRWKYGRAAHFIAVSDFVRAGMVERGIPAEKISVVYDGAPLLPPTERGHRILAPHPSPDKPAQLYRQTGLDIFCAENLEDDLKTASIFVYISYSEGLGSAVLLAMSAGVPVVASNTGGIGEIIRHEENGLLVEGGPAAIAKAVRRLEADGALARKLAANGRRTVMERFSIDGMVRNTLSVYRRVLGC
jgi:glycosyl transferase family 1/glycosyl transferase family 4